MGGGGGGARRQHGGGYQDRGTWKSGCLITMTTFLRRGSVITQPATASAPASASLARGAAAPAARTRPARSSERLDPQAATRSAPRRFLPHLPAAPATAARRCHVQAAAAAADGGASNSFKVAIYSSQPYVLDFLQHPMEAAFDASHLRVCGGRRAGMGPGVPWRPQSLLSRAPPEPASLLPALQFIEARLDKVTAELAHGCKAICLFVNDACDADVGGAGSTERAAAAALPQAE